MSSDYSPRGGSNSGSGSGSSSGGGGPRRRRGGRNRGGRGRTGSGENRPYTNGTSTSSTPAKKESPISKLFGWLTGKKKTAEPKPFASRPSAPRAEFRDTPRDSSRDTPREPRAERPRREEPARADIPAQEIVSPKLYVGNLAYEAAESDLFDLFSKVGAVKNVEVAVDRHANRSKGFGFVEMESLDSAKAAAEKLNRTDFMGRQIVVSGAKLEKRSVNKREEEPTGADETSD
jgi:RNA recognition motif-containing protein